MCLYKNVLNELKIKTKYVNDHLGDKRGHGQLYYDCNKTNRVKCLCDEIPLCPRVSEYKCKYYKLKTGWTIRISLFRES